MAGIDSFFQTKVGDNWDRIQGALELALTRSDAVIVCGGLGPTQDDITRDVIADVMGVDARGGPRGHREAARTCSGAVAARCPRNNLRQALVPVGCVAHRPAAGHRARA